MLNSNVFHMSSTNLQCDVCAADGQADPVLLWGSEIYWEQRQSLFINKQMFCQGKILHI